MSVPMISALCQPYDRVSDLLICDSFKAIMEIAKPKISEPKCAASENTAIEPESQPP